MRTHSIRPVTIRVWFWFKRIFPIEFLSSDSQRTKATDGNKAQIRMCRIFRVVLLHAKTEKKLLSKNERTINLVHAGLPLHSINAGHCAKWGRDVMQKGLENEFKTLFIYCCISFPCCTCHSRCTQPILVNLIADVQTRVQTKCARVSWENYIHSADRYFNEIKF